MTTAPHISLDSFKLPTVFSNDGVVHTRRSGNNEIWADISVLGHGGQGTVYLQQLQTGPTPLLRAVKELSQDQRISGTGHVMRELTTMLAVRDHEELFVQLYGWYEDLRGTVFLAMEYVQYGDLSQYIKTTPNAWRNSREVTKQLVTGLSVLHSRQICHRDLKPQNVLLASLTPIKVKLADFGISKSTVGTDLRTRIGTTHYMAPEQLGLLPLRLRLGNEYTTAVDMWAMGFIVYELLTGKTPFLETPVELMSSGYPTMDTEQLETDMRLLLQFCDGSTTFPLSLLEDIKTSNTAIEFVRSLVVPDTRSRASAAQALRDPWITGQPEPRCIPLEDRRVEPARGPSQDIPRNEYIGFEVRPSPYLPRVPQQTSSPQLRSASDNYRALARGLQAHYPMGWVPSRPVTPISKAQHVTFDPNTTVFPESPFDDSPTPVAVTAPLQGQRWGPPEPRIAEPPGAEYERSQGQRSNPDRARGVRFAPNTTVFPGTSFNDSPHPPPLQGQSWGQPEVEVLDKGEYERFLRERKEWQSIDPMLGRRNRRREH